MSSIESFDIFVITTIIIVVVVFHFTYIIIQCRRLFVHRSLANGRSGGADDAVSLLSVWVLISDRDGACVPITAVMADVNIGRLVMFICVLRLAPLRI